MKELLVQYRNIVNLALAPISDLLLDPNIYLSPAEKRRLIKASEELFAVRDSLELRWDEGEEE